MVNREELKRLLADTVPRIDWNTDRPLMEDGLLDSLDVLMIVSRLYGEFQVEIPSTELTAANFNSVESIQNLCRKCKDAAGEKRSRIFKIKGEERR